MESIMPMATYRDDMKRITKQFFKILISESSAKWIALDCIF